MAIVEWNKDGTVAVIMMNNGENLHNPEWAEAMLTTYHEIISDTDIKAIVLTSTDPKNFSLGMDLGFVMKKVGENDYLTISKALHRNNEVFRSLLMAPVPTIAAVNGHAFGNGFILAGVCDFRFMRADRGYACFPEIDLGIQITPSMLEWMKRIVPYHFLIKMILTGEKVGAAELEKQNIILKACENSEKTVEEAIAFAKTFNKSRTAMAEMKNRVYKHIIDKMEEEDPQYLDCKPEAVKEGRLPVFMMTPLT